MHIEEAMCECWPNTANRSLPQKSPNNPTFEAKPPFTFLNSIPEEAQLKDKQVYLGLEF